MCLIYYSAGLRAKSLGHLNERVNSARTGERTLEAEQRKFQPGSHCEKCASPVKSFVSLIIIARTQWGACTHALLLSSNTRVTLFTAPWNPCQEHKDGIFTHKDKIFHFCQRPQFFFKSFEKCRNAIIFWRVYSEYLQKGSRLWIFLCACIFSRGYNFTIISWIFLRWNIPNWFERPWWKYFHHQQK